MAAPPPPPPPPSSPPVHCQRSDINVRETGAGLKEAVCGKEGGLPVRRSHDQALVLLASLSPGVMGGEPASDHFPFSFISTFGLSLLLRRNKTNDIPHHVKFK
ncbi:hypothetical protein SKAU_G00084740 [Synaphobranchus kaupii]|uniref:Uncharacterized protein n=1 Tax=Synaphobranchus kaupii TaxID=118154 RepID=A0A9Q1J5V6_SYNKA|nr:hypothetical protein SKAU_G00084740 [Synaphobranchus kaupii]